MLFEYRARWAVGLYGYRPDFWRSTGGRWAQLRLDPTLAGVADAGRRVRTYWLTREQTEALHAMLGEALAEWPVEDVPPSGLESPPREPVGVVAR